MSVISRPLEVFDRIVTDNIQEQAFNTLATPSFDTAPPTDKIERTDLSVEGFDGEFPVWTQVPADREQAAARGVCIIAAPGLTKGLDELKNYFEVGAELGVPVIGIMPQSYSGAPKSKNGLATYGQGGSPEIVAAMDFARDAGIGNRAVLAGVSHGAAVALGGAMADLKEGNKRIAGYSFMAPALSARTAISRAAPAELLNLANHVPNNQLTRTAVIPIAEPIAYAGTLRLARTRGINWREIDYVRRIKNGEAGTTPMQIIHCQDDAVIPIQGSVDVAHASADKAIVYFDKIPTGGHVEGWNAVPGLYTAKIGRFIQRQILNSYTPGL